MEEGSLWGILHPVVTGRDGDLEARPLPIFTRLPYGETGDAEDLSHEEEAVTRGSIGAPTEDTFLLICGNPLPVVLAGEE